MRGKKGTPHPDPKDPPRRRANKARGHGDYEGDRPAVFGAVCRRTGKAHLRVVKDSSAESLLFAFLEETEEGTQTYTDEWRAYSGLKKEGRLHGTVNHSKREWARDDDGDGIREVHTNSLEGFWTSLRNWLRVNRGVAKKYLHGYVASFEWIWNRKSLHKANLYDVLLHRLQEGITYEPG